MLDPAVSDFWVSWQDRAALADDVITGAENAIAWGRERSETILIRLGHSSGTYFSAGTKLPDPSDEWLDEPWPPPPWPPQEPPEGWWYPPPLPTLNEVAEEARKLAAGEIRQHSAREWAEVRLLAHALDEPELMRALWKLRGTDDPIDG
jgi:hypothetical protein